MAGNVSQAYLMGIREGREFLKAFPDCDPAEELAACKAMLAQGFSGDMAEFIRGERDFWKKQVRKGSAE